MNFLSFHFNFHSSHEYRKTTDKNLLDHIFYFQIHGRQRKNENEKNDENFINIEKSWNYKSLSWVVVGSFGTVGRSVCRLGGNGDGGDDSRRMNFLSLPSAVGI